MTDPRVLGSRYEVGRLLGHGGMAEVHLGRDTRLGRDVAVKLLRPDLARDPTFQARFRREAQSAASLNHPAIVAVYDTGEEGGTPYIVMEYVEGRTLRDVLAAEGRLYPQRALEITADICRALNSAHRAGIVHRDVKPGNVMLTPAGDVKVMDFGIARAVTASSTTMTQTAAVIGTAQYLSPEQARGEHVDARSDVYSVGCLLYELLTGTPPFTGDTPVAVAYQHVREDPVPPSRLDTDISASLDAIVLKAMAKNPANRYQTADEMRADIDRALAGRPVEATPVLADELTTLPPPPPTTVLLRRPEQRHRGRALAYVMLALAALAVFVVALVVFRGLLGSTGAEVNTPDVTGRSLSEAEQILQSKGLRTGKISEQYTAKDDAGLVIDQDPQPDIFLNKGDSVDLVVSKGIQFVNVPPLVGLSQNDAANALKQAGLKVGGVRKENNPAPPDQVLSSDPAEGTRVAAGTGVTLVVSNGQVQVPDVRGKTVGEARQILQQQGFKVTLEPSSSPDTAKVLSQNPVGGSYAANGSTVTVTSDAPSPTPSASASPSPTTTATGVPPPTVSPTP